MRIIQASFVLSISSWQEHEVTLSNDMLNVYVKETFLQKFGKAETEQNIK